MTMTARTVCCDQAIFTSVRTPMGEGYRIIAASKGLTAEERKALTKLSPSHDSLCKSDAGKLGRWNKWRRILPYLRRTILRGMDGDCGCGTHRSGWSARSTRTTS